MPKEKKRAYRAGKHALVAVLPQDDFDALKALCTETGQTEHEITRLAIAHYLKVHKRLKTQRK